MPPIKVAIVEDDQDVRDGMAFLFRQSPELRCVAACASAEQALQTLPKLSPDVVLLDIQLPGASGLECLPALKAACPELQVCMLTVFADADRVFAALKAGATGYLLKKTPPLQVLEAIKDLHAGGSPMSSQIARKLVTAFANHNAVNPPPAPSPEASLALCTREREILELLAKGYRYKEIADQLGITIHTVRTFIRRMYEKLHVHSRTEALLKTSAR